MRSTVCAVLISAALLPAAAGAADVPGFDGQRFSPAAGIAGGFSVERPFVAPHLGYGFGLFLNYADDAVVTRNGSGSVVQRPLDSALTFDLLASLGLFDFLEVGVDLPIHAVYEGDPLVVNGRFVSATQGVGDLRLVPKVALPSAGSRWAVGFAVPITLPTGSSDGLRGDGVVTAEPKLLFGLRGGRWGVTLNGGIRLRPGRQALGQEMTYGGAAQLAVFPARDLLDVVVEANGGAFLNPDLPAIGRHPVEALAGVIFKPFHAWQFYLGGGPGLTSGVGAPDYRIMAGVRFAPRPAGSSYADGDGDGVPDFADKCPMQAGDKDDGCPEADRDHDGVPDDVDECPDEPGLPPDGCPPGEVTYREKKIFVRGKIQFETGSATLKASSDRIIDGVATVLREHPEIQHMRVDGHTDDVGPAETNRVLSERRAGAVRDALVKRGIDPRRLAIHGFGKTQPIAPNTTKAGQSMNRRVEFTITE